MPTQRKYGLIGKSLNHSFSQSFFTEKFATENINAQYNLYELADISEIKDLMKTPDLQGLNVTIPYKKLVLTYVDEMSNEVKEIGAANTLAKLPNGKWKAFNTDVFGFEESVKQFLKPNTKALILGKGGASKAVEFVLKKLKVPYLIISRQPKFDGQLFYKEVTQELLQSYPLIVNATPVGTFPNIKTVPVLPYHSLNEKNVLFDLVYNPAETEFLKKGKLAGATIKNGLEMLHLQAQKSWAIWSETV